jgi:MFS family permease
VLVWRLSSTTGSATILATATLVALLPQIFLSPFAGALVDRWNRRIVMMVADGTIAAFSLLLAFLFATGQVHIWHVFVIMLIRSAGGAMCALMGIAGFFIQPLIHMEDGVPARAPNAMPAAPTVMPAGINEPVP